MLRVTHLTPERRRRLVGLCATITGDRGAAEDTPEGEPGLNYLCAGYKDFFHHVDRPMRFMAEQLRRNLAPADVMHLYAAEDAHRGRNDRCTCGSGRKWKHCHGAAPMTALEDDDPQEPVRRRESPRRGRPHQGRTPTQDEAHGLRE